MKKYLSVFIILASIINSCCNSNQKNKDSIQLTCINGKIVNYIKPLPDEVNVMVTDIINADMIVYKQQIDSMGNFTFHIPLYLAQDIMIKYNNKRYYLLLEPGDIINVELNTGNKPDSIVFKGVKSELNSEINSFISIYLQHFATYDDVSNYIEKNADEYKRLLLNEQSYFDSVAHCFIIQHKVLPEAQQWIQSYIKYSCGNSLLQLFFYPENRVPDDLKKFAAEYPLEYNDTYVNSEYINYNKTFIGHLIRRSKQGQTIGNYYNKQNYAGVLIEGEKLIRNQVNGLAKDIALCNLCSSGFVQFFSTVDSCINNQQIKIQTPALENELKNRINKIKEAQNKNDSSICLHEYQNSNQPADILEMLIHEKLKGKVVYVDFWATYCGPCKVQFSYSTRLHQYYHDKNVAFVYVCCESKPELWKEIIYDMQLKGEHVLLTKEQYRFIGNKYQIQGFPTYLIFNKNGELVRNKAPYPSSKEIRPLLDSLLAK